MIWQIFVKFTTRWQTFVRFAIVVVACMLEHTCNLGDFYSDILACLFLQEKGAFITF